MRSFADRLRHAILFELIGLALVIPLAALAFGLELGESGVVAVVSAAIAMFWVYFYNWGVDRLLLRRRGHTRKSVKLRVVHAVVFEAGLLVLLIPFIAWHLELPLLEALVLDIGFAGFYVVYAFVYNWVYDAVFPVPAAR
jgi:uncharacterized membrane protein